MERSVIFRLEEILVEAIGQEAAADLMEEIQDHYHTLYLPG